MSLSAMLKEHQIRQIKRREEIEQKRNAAIVSSVDYTSKLVSHLNDAVAQTYVNQKKLDAEAKRLVENIDQLGKSIDQWSGLMTELNTTLKEIGDVKNWSGVIERDLREISSILEYVNKENIDRGGEASQ